MGQAGPLHWQSSWRVAKETSSVCGCRWRTVWTQDVNTYHLWYFISEFSDQTLWNTAVLFSKNWLFCWVQCVLWLHFVTAIILCCTKNIYKIYNCKPHRLKVNFLTNKCCNFHSNRLTFEKVIAKIQRVPILWNTVYTEITQLHWTQLGLPSGWLACRYDLPSPYKLHMTWLSSLHNQLGFILDALTNVLHNNLLCKK